MKVVWGRNTWKGKYYGRKPMAEIYDEVIDAMIEEVERHISAVKRMSMEDGREGEHMLMRKVEGHLQNCIYFKAGLREHFIKKV